MTLRAVLVLAATTLVVVILQYGFLRHLPGIIGTLPLLTVMGLYAFLQLRTQVGLYWFFLAGVLADLHRVQGGVDVFIGAIMGLLLIYVIRQYVTHASIYAGTGLGFATIIVWGVIRAFFHPEPLWGILQAATIGAVTLALFMVVGPRTRKSLQRYIRLA